MLFQGIKWNPPESRLIPLNHFGARFGAHDLSYLTGKNKSLMRGSESVAAIAFSAPNLPIESTTPPPQPSSALFQHLC